MSDTEADHIRRIVKENQPAERETIERLSNLSSAKTREMIREMLYNKQLATTPDWKYEVR